MTAPTGAPSSNSLRIDRPAQALPASDASFGVRVYRLATPLAAGDTLAVRYGATYTVRGGFDNGKSD